MSDALLPACALLRNTCTLLQPALPLPIVDPQKAPDHEHYRTTCDLALLPLMHLSKHLRLTKRNRRIVHLQAYIVPPQPRPEMVKILVPHRILPIRASIASMLRQAILQSWLMAAPPRWKLAIICAVTSAG